MQTLKRYKYNPILVPNPKSRWDNIATFNGCPVKLNENIGLVYRADTNFVSVENTENFPEVMSTVGLSLSKDGKNFESRRQIIKPEYEWEKYGCENPTVTKIQDEYFIFYTALSQFPFNADGIKTALAITKDFKKFEKHQVTTFNSKATVLFPEKINGKYLMLLTVNTDLPPETAKICMASFDKKEDMFSPDYWNKFYSQLDEHLFGLKRGKNEQSEIGTPPIKTKKGWLLIYSYAQNYFTDNKNFTIEAALLDLKDPRKILGTTKYPIITPKEDYEIYGRVRGVTFPSGAYIDKDMLHFYYGGADTVTCLATCKVADLTEKILNSKSAYISLERLKSNPLISPTKNDWENKATFNSAAVYLDKKIHLLYRAMGNDNISRIGYASLKDPEKIEKRLKNPIYSPRNDLENRGCEDPRIVYIEKEKKLYMTYVAYDGRVPRVALTSISKEDFLAQKWNWEDSKIISQMNLDDKDSSLLSEKINGKYLLFHRIKECICANYVDDLDFKKEKLWLNAILPPRDYQWDSDKVGIAAPPIKTKEGWILLYHGVSKYDRNYRVGVVLLDKKDPTEIISRLDYPILEPETKDEKEGIVNNVVFSCGAVIKKDTLYVYYGAADEKLSVAKIKIERLLKELKRNITKEFQY